MNASTEKRSPAVCPFCGESYDAPPALSRADGESIICPDCGIREALTSIGTPREEQEKILAIIHEHVSKGRDTSNEHRP